ncbi:SUN domain-containing protein 1 isoform X9 [Falco rusticolus]|uniref:SUN domain-containing protein 1 isoform X9 n=1 Tax=Falco rusticolus TaxID=120794 RepID=UPI001886645E|nr:SUN domain-containing protein 1 isoform X9 [Falco rusticolus]XP_055564697.1 SUN domain-containing protein 1 isoform X8 [Falco cherrug]
MSRRSLRLAAAGFSKSEEAQNDALRDSSYAGNFSFREHSSKMAKQHRSTNKRSGSARQTPRRTLSSSSIFSQSSFNSHAGDSSMDVLDESLIQERTEVGHFWGLDEEGDPKVSDAAPIQGNGDVATTEAETSMINGYTCSGCSMLSERKEVLTAHSASPVPSSTIYSRDRSRKHAYRRAASGMFSLLRTRWYQLVTLMSLLKVVLLKRCLPKTYKLLLFLIPLLFLLGIGFWGFGGSISLLPSLSWTRTDRIGRTDDYTHLPEPQADSSHSGGCTKDTMTVFDAGRISQLEKQVAFMSDRCHHSDEEYSKVLLLLRNLQDQVAQMSDKSETLKLIKNVVGQHLKDKELEEKTDFLALHKEHQLRILTLEELLGKLSTESKDIQKELDAAKAKPVRDDDEHNQLLSRIKKLELELTQMKSELLTGESVKTSCEKLDVIPEKVDAWVKEYVKLMLFGDQQEDFPESLLQWLMSNFVSQNDLQTLLQDLEFQILKNITLHMSVTNQKLTSEVVTNAVTNAGISGITEAQVQIIVNNALKLYSQDKIGMVDFALESGGGSIVSTRCSETYETKTALFSLFGIPLWYMSQSPRVVIQPDIHPGNCWAFRGSPGYLVVKLSMKIYPTAFTVEHIPKTLSPTGNITSAPKNFSVYGLDDEYQEDGTLLGQYVYDQEGEPLQMFPVMEKSEKTFQIVELRIFSNWGHEKYTCLYRFRVHGKPAE